MPDNPFKQAIAARKQQSAVEPEPIAEPTPEPVPEAKVESTKQKAAGRKRSPKSALVAKPEPQQPRKRGRPPTGKRSDDEWIGRTFYVKRETDLDVEMQLLQLKRQGLDIDKSELVEILLSAWVKWHQGENLEIQIGEISPIQKSKKPKI